MVDKIGNDGQTMTKIKEKFEHHISARKHYLTIHGIFIAGKEKIPNFSVLCRAAAKFELDVLEAPHIKRDYPLVTLQVNELNRTLKYILLGFNLFKSTSTISGF